MRRTRVVGRDAVGRGGELLDRLDHLVALLEQVARQRVVGLLGVPRAAARAAEAFGEREQAGELPCADAPAAGTNTAVRWSGSTTRSRSASATVRDALVGQAEPLEHA